MGLLIFYYFCPKKDYGLLYSLLCLSMVAVCCVSVFWNADCRLSGVAVGACCWFLVVACWLSLVGCRLPVSAVADFFPKKFSVS
jgi:hypothetical protein